MSDLRLYNTLTRDKEEFKPIDPANVRMYVCGPTVYDLAHLGNARPVVVFDVLYRLLQRRYGAEHVTYVRNITDVDDKIINKSRETGEPIDSITARTTAAYHEDMAALNALPPTHEPRATEHIPQMIAMIEALIPKHAYEKDGHVLFHVPSMENYGELSRRNRDELVAGARVEVAPYKRDPADFILWKPSTPDQPGWDSPWGRGRPGWHIECSAMAAQYLGKSFDIHGGGLDLIFPHHENEIAQSCCAHGTQRMANVWMHNGFLTIDNDKMSKSLGNFFTVRDLLKKYHSEVIRLVLLSAHYRQPLDFSEAALEQAKATLDRWYGALRCLELSVYADLPSIQPQQDKETAVSAIIDILNDDLNTPQAIAFIHTLADKIFKADSIGNRGDLVDLTPQMRSTTSMLGLLQQDPEAWFRWQPAGQEGLTDAEIAAQIQARLDARKSKDFAEADRIRKSLADQGVILEDKPDGATEWRRG